MKKIFTLSYLFASIAAFSQTENVGIGTTSPDNSAILDLSSSSKGFLVPRMTKSDIVNISKPAVGLQVYQTDEDSGLKIFNGTIWVGSANSIAAVNDPWVFGGNSVTASDFIGTTNAERLRFRVQNFPAGYIDNNGSSAGVFLGRGSGTNNTGTYSTGYGYSTLTNNTGTQNTAVGAFSMFTNTTGNNNVALGPFTLYDNTIGAFNLAVGNTALRYNTTGSNNMGLGNGALLNNTTGSRNVSVGSSAMILNSTGSDNLGIGFDALRSNTIGNRNVAIGSYSGRLTTGTGNIFIGFRSGENETGNDKLYVANSNTSTPLIYGDFSAKYVTIGDVSPTQRTQGVATGGYNLLVKGGILTEKVKVALASSVDWADYVFEPGYSLLSLEEVENYTKTHKHLPNVPSAEEMVANGLDVNETSKMFMEKIEELTLYIIELNKQIQELKK